MIDSHNDILWPVPQSHSKMLPRDGASGCFWENRGDRFHCGVDIYAPLGCDVLAVDAGVVVRTELFTSPEMINYWNDTLAVTIKHECRLIIRYAEMGDLLCHVGQKVRRGENIGHVGQVLQPARIKDQSPLYIKKLNLFLISSTLFT